MPSNNQFLSSVKMVSPEVKVFVLHPGEHKKYFELIHRSCMIFLNIPGMDLHVEDLNTPNLLRKKLRRTIDISEGKTVLDLNQYSDAPRGISSLYGSFTSLYARAKIGDLIIVPNRGYFEPFLLGEIISDFNEEDLLSIYSNEFPTPCRKVRWLPQKKSKCQISESLSNQMSNRKAIIEINENKLIKEVLSLAYGKYIYNDSSKSYFSGSTYNSSNLQGIIDALTAINELSRTIDPDTPIDIKINFNSPGGICITSGGRKAIFIAALISSCLAGCDYDDVQIEYRLVSEDDVYCNSIMASLDSNTYRSICAKANSAKDQINFEVE